MGLINIKTDQKYMKQKLNTYFPQNNMMGFMNFPMPNLSMMPSFPTPSFPTPSLFTPSFNFAMPSSYSSSIMELYNTLFGKTNTSSNTTNFTSVRMTGNMGKDIVATAKQYVGYKESDGSFKLFTGGKNHAWCADFVSYVIKEAYKGNGKQIPSGLNTSSVESLRKWGINNNCYLNTSNSSNKSSLIAKNVKPGDVVIFKNGTSHTGIVTKVNSDGSFQTIEGNTSNKVAYRNYSSTDSKVSGFIQIA